MSTRFTKACIAFGSNRWRHPLVLRGPRQVSTVPEPFSRALAYSLALATTVCPGCISAGVPTSTFPRGRMAITVAESVSVETPLLLIPYKGWEATR